MNQAARSGRSHPFTTLLAATVVLLGSVLSPAHAQLIPGDAVVIDDGTATPGALFRVDVTTGARTILSDFGNPAQGPLGSDPSGVVLEPSGQILVIDPNAGTGTLGALFRVDPTTGTRTILSDFGDAAQGPLGANPSGVALEASGQILVIDAGEGPRPRGALFRVDAVMGARTILSDFGNPAQGPPGAHLSGVTVEASGQILVTDLAAAGTPLFPNAVLFRVDATTGARTILSDFGNPAQGPLAAQPGGVAVEASGQILVTGNAPTGALLRVDATTGVRTILSNFGNPAQGPLGISPFGVALEALGQILVIDRDSLTFRGALFRVDATTGARTLLSDFGDPSQGPLGFDPTGVAVVPAANDPTEKRQCTSGGWAAFGFKNQGQCVRFIETGKDSRTGK